MQSKSVHNKVIRQYNRLARKYDTVWKKYNAATIDETLARVDAGNSKTMLDVGCGTGILIDRLNNLNGNIHYYGCDISKEMINIAKSKVPTNNVKFAVSTAESLPYSDDMFDMVFSTSVLHFVRDREKMIGEIKRVLKSNGTFVLTDWCMRYKTIRMLNFILRYFDPAHYQCLNVDECAELLENNGFVIQKADCYKIGTIWGMMTIVGGKRQT